MRGFTLPQLLVAVAVLIVIIAATAKIFGTAGKVTGLGQASADVIAEAAAIEQQFRQDIDRIHEEGFLAIRCIAVRNDVNGDVLLNPVLPANAWIRADQLLYFVKGVTGTQVFGLQVSSGSNRKGQSTEARVYWGHAFQLGQLGRAFNMSQQSAHDLKWDQPMFPWYSAAVEGPADTVLTIFKDGGTTDNFNWTDDTEIDVTQPEARQWVLARQNVLFAHDNDPGLALNDNARSVYLTNNLSAKSIFHQEIRNSRVDAASTGMGFIRSNLLSRGTWGFQRDAIQNELLFYPRAERIAPSMHRVDQALTTPVIGSACSDFKVDWSWDEGTGFFDPDDIPNNDNELFGIDYFDPERVWFGMPDANAFFENGAVTTDPQRAVSMYSDDPANNAAPFNAARYLPAETIVHPLNPQFPSGTEFNTANEQIYSPANGVVIYEATFGYNRVDPIDPNTGTPTFDHGYTPWPGMLRITMTLHDPETKLEHGREVQFVVRLPERTQ